MCIIPTAPRPMPRFPEQLLVPLCLLTEIVVVHAVGDRLAFQVRRDHPKVLGMLQILLLEQLLLAGRPHVKELAALVLCLHVDHVAVVVAVDNAAPTRVQEYGRDDRVAPHLLVLQSLLLEVVHYFLQVRFGFYSCTHPVKSENKQKNTTNIFNRNRNV